MEPLPGGVHPVARCESDLGPPNGADAGVNPAPGSRAHSNAEAQGHALVAESGEVTVAVRLSLQVPAGTPEENYCSSWADFVSGVVFFIFASMIYIIIFRVEEYVN